MIPAIRTLSLGRDADSSLNCLIRRKLPVAGEKWRTDLQWTMTSSPVPCVITTRRASWAKSPENATSTSSSVIRAHSSHWPVSAATRQQQHCTIMPRQRLRFIRACTKDTFSRQIFTSTPPHVAILAHCRRCPVLAVENRRHCPGIHIIRAWADLGQVWARLWFSGIRDNNNNTPKHTLYWCLLYNRMKPPLLHCHPWKCFIFSITHTILKLKRKRLDDSLKITHVQTRLHFQKNNKNEQKCVPKLKKAKRIYNLPSKMPIFNYTSILIWKGFFDSRCPNTNRQIYTKHQLQPGATSTHLKHISLFWF